MRSRTLPLLALLLAVTLTPNLLPGSAAGRAAAEPAGAPTSAPASAPDAAARVIQRDALLPDRADLMRDVRRLVRMAPRQTGTPGGRKAAEYVADRLREAGMDKVWIEKSVSYSWKASGASLSVGGRRIDQTPVSFSFIKGPEGTGTRTLGRRGLTAPVVDLGSLSPSAIGALDLRGKIVMVDLKFLTPLVTLAPLMEFMHDPEGEILDAQTLLTPNPYITSLSLTLDAIQEAGAAGMIGVLADYFDSHKYRNEYYRRSPMTIPGMWVTKKEAARVRALLATHGHRATMKLTTTRRKVVARQPIGILEGRSKDTIMVQSHHDSMGPGAVEDGTGTAEVLGLADYYGALAGRGVERDKTLMFTTFDTHFTGYHAHQHFVKKFIQRHATPYRIVANDTIEHVAKKGRVGPDGELKILDETEPRGFFENLSLAGKAMMMRTIVKHDLRATTMLNGAVLGRVGIPTDASWVMASGVPTISLIAGPLYLYDDADTIAAVDQRSLRPVLAANRDFIDWFEATPSGQIGLLPSAS